MLRGWKSSIWIGVTCSSLAGAAGLSDISASVTNAFGRLEQLQNSLSNSKVQGADPMDRAVITNHYSEIRRDYLANPLNTFLTNSRASLSQFGQDTGKALGDMETQFGTSFVAKSALSQCLERAKFDKLDSALSDYTNSLTSAVQTLGRRFPDRLDEFYDSSKDSWGASSRDQLSRAVQVYDQDWAEGGSKCCTQAVGAFVDKMDKAEQDRESARLLQGCKNFKTQMAKVQEDMKGKMTPPSVDSLPDPLMTTRLAPADLAHVIQQNGPRLRAANAQMDSSTADIILAEAEQECRREVREKQKHSSPLEGSTKGAILGAVGSVLGTAWCTGVQGAAAQWWTLNTQQLVSALGMASGCDPNTIAFFNDMRSPYKIGQNYNFDGALKPFQDLQARLPMMMAPFQDIGMLVLPNGGTLSATGSTGVFDPNNSLLAATMGGVAAASGAGRGQVVPSSAGRSLVGASISGRRVAASRGISSGTTRGLVEGAGYTRVARGLASEIKRGHAPLRNATTLKSVASSARGLVSQMVANNAKQGTGEQRRRALASEAATVRTAVRGLASARASTTTARQTAESLRGRARPGRTTVAAPPGTMTSWQEMQKKIEQARVQAEAKARQIAGNLKLIQSKAEDFANQVASLTQQAQLAASAAFRDMINLPPKKQLERMNQLRVQLADLHKQIAPLTASIYQLQSAKIEQKVAYDNLFRFNPQIANGATPQTGLGTSTGPTNNNGGRGTVTPTTTRDNSAQLELPDTRWPQIFDWFVRPAQAAQGPAKLSDAEYLVEWDKFVKDCEASVVAKEAEEKRMTAVVVDLLKQRAANIKAGGVTDFDTDYLVTLDLYTRSVEEESNDLVEAALTKGPDSIPLDGNVIALLKQARDEARSTQEGLAQLTQQYKESYPQSADDNPEAWWAMVPELLAN